MSDLENIAPQFAWVILAGGLGRRMGGKDKGWVNFAGKPLIVQIIQRLQNHSKEHDLNIPIIINANQNLDRYQELGFPVVSDKTDLQNKIPFKGPLAGILSIMKNSKTQPKQAWLTWPVDAPFIATDYAPNMIQQSKKQGVVVAINQLENQAQYTHLCISTTMQSALNKYLESGQGSIKGFIASLNSEKKHFVKFHQTNKLDWLNLNLNPESYRTVDPSPNIS